MRRIYGVTLGIVAVLLLVVLARGSALGAGLNPQGTAVYGVNSKLLDRNVPDGTRKLPPADKGQPVPADPNLAPRACVETVVNVSATLGNQQESHHVVNPNNPQNLVVFSNLSSGSNIFRAYTTDGGTTWTRGTVATGVACCDAQAAFDSFGNLFMVYINGSVNQINVINSTDGGATFSAPVLAGTGSVDQPSIAVGNGSLWVDWNSSGSMVARGAPVTGLGTWGPFNALQTIPTASGSFGGIAVGPGPNGGKVMVTYQNPTGGQGPATIYANVDADGLGAGGFAARITVSTTNVGGFDYIPAQNGRSIDSEAGLVWDATGGPFNDRVYLVYTEEPINENNDTEIYLRTSTDSGTTWTAPVRVNDDPLGPIRSQFLPYVTLDRTSGTVAIGFHDARNDNGVPGSGGTNGIPNDDSEYYASYSTNGGLTWSVNQRLSGGFSNAAAAASGVDYGDYVATDAYGGKFYGLWADNANCDGTNPDGTLSKFDLYMGIMTIPGGGTPTPTRTGTPPTATRTPTLTNTPTQTNTPTAVPTVCGNVLVNGGFETGAFPPWVILDSAPAPVVSNLQAHSGTFSGHVGSLPGGETPGDSSFYQTIVVPAAGGTLSYWYWPRTVDSITFDWQDAYVTNTSGAVLTTIMHVCLNTQAWTNVTFNMAPYAGQTVRIKFLAHGDNAGDPTDMFVDDVTLATACATGTPATATNTTVPATATRTNTVVVPPTATATNTPVPPTAISTSTNTAVPPTAISTSTNTVVPPTATHCAINFADVLPSNTFYANIRCLACRGIINGYPCGGTGEPCNGNNDPYFRPGNNISRGQVAKIVAQSAGLNAPVSGQSFEDVLPGTAFYTYTERLFAIGAIGGYTCGIDPNEPCIPPGNKPYYRPGASVTRGQLTKIVSIAAGFNNPAPMTFTFTDVPVGSTFHIYVERLLTNRPGVMQGYPCGGVNPQSGQAEPCDSQNRAYFRVNNNLSRGQASKIVGNTFFPGCVTPNRPAR